MHEKDCEKDLEPNEDINIARKIELVKFSFSVSNDQRYICSFYVFTSSQNFSDNFNSNSDIILLELLHAKLF